MVSTGGLTLLAFFLEEASIVACSEGFVLAALQVFHVGSVLCIIARETIRDYPVSLLKLRKVEVFPITDQQDAGVADLEE